MTKPTQPPEQDEIQSLRKLNARVSDAIQQLQCVQNEVTCLITAHTKVTRVNCWDYHMLQRLAMGKTVGIMRDGSRYDIHWCPRRNQWWIIDTKTEVNDWHKTLPQWIKELFHPPGREDALVEVLLR